MRQFSPVQPTLDSHVEDCLQNFRSQTSVACSSIINTELNIGSLPLGKGPTFNSDSLKVGIVVAFCQKLGRGTVKCLIQELLCRVYVEVISLPCLCYTTSRKRQNQKVGVQTLTGTVLVDYLLCRESISVIGSVLQSSYSGSLFVLSQ